MSRLLFLINDSIARKRRRVTTNPLAFVSSKILFEAINDFDPFSKPR